MQVINFEMLYCAYYDSEQLTWENHPRYHPPQQDKVQPVVCLDALKERENYGGESLQDIPAPSSSHQCHQYSNHGFL